MKVSFEGNLADLPCGSTERAEFTRGIEEGLLASLGVGVLGVKVLGLESGSIIVEFEVEVEEDYDQDLEAELDSALKDPNSQFSSRMPGMAVNFITPPVLHDTETELRTLQEVHSNLVKEYALLEAEHVAGAARQSHDTKTIETLKATLEGLTLTHYRALSDMTNLDASHQSLLEQYAAIADQHAALQIEHQELHQQHSSLVEFCSTLQEEQISVLHESTCSLSQQHSDIVAEHSELQVYSPSCVPALT